jgi:hypothetical protein
MGNSKSKPNSKNIGKGSKTTLDSPSPDNKIRKDFSSTTCSSSKNKEINDSRTGNSLEKNYEESHEFGSQKKEENLINTNNFDLKKFQIIKLIGKGSSGKVYLSKLNNEEQYFAIKVVNKKFLTNKMNLLSLRTEKMILSRIRHRFIIDLKYSFQTNEKVFFVYEYLNGGDLYFHLQKASKFSEEICKFYAIQIYLAICHLHENNIVYR